MINSEYISKFLNSYIKDNNGRYKSYDHCRQCFIKNRKNKDKYDEMSLSLYAYLASWGMLRNSFLMQKDYLFNKPIIEILCKDEYDSLLNFNPFKDNNEKEIDLIIKLKEEIKNYYLGKTYYKAGKDNLEEITSVTDTLITKIMLGTLGCIPAYDQYLVDSLRKEKMCSKFNKKSIEQIIEYAKENKELIESFTSELGELYTPMKIIDMYFFEKGIRKEAKNKKVIK